MGTHLPSPETPEDRSTSGDSSSDIDTTDTSANPPTTDLITTEQIAPEQDIAETPPWVEPTSSMRRGFLRRIFIDELTRPMGSVDKTLQLALKKARGHTFMSALSVGIALGTAFVGYVLELGLDTGIEVWLTFTTVFVLMSIGLPVMLTRKWPLVLLAWIATTIAVAYYLGSGMVGLSAALFAVLMMVYLASEDLVPLIFAGLLANTVWYYTLGMGAERAFVAGGTFIGSFIALLRFGSGLLRALATFLWTIFSLSIAGAVALLVAGEAAPSRWWSKLPLGPSVLVFTFIVFAAFGIFLTSDPKQTNKPA